MSGIFLSYRRNDASGHAGRLYDRLIGKFGGQRVFRDLETIDLGLDFGEAVEKALLDCGVVIVLIGRTWVSQVDAKGRRRLDLEGDWVRLEVETALKRHLRIIPALVEDAIMPSAEELPEPLRPLARRNAIELSDERWDHDCGRLMSAIERVLGDAPAQAVLAPGIRAQAPPAPAVAPPAATQQFSPVELVGSWFVEIHALIPGQMRIVFGQDWSCSGTQSVMGVDVSFIGRWGCDPANLVIQVQGAALFQPLQFGMRLTSRTQDGFTAADLVNPCNYILHRLA